MWEISSYVITLFRYKQDENNKIFFFNSSVLKNRLEPWFHNNIIEKKNCQKSWHFFFFRFMDFYVGTVGTL